MGIEGIVSKTDNILKHILVTGLGVGSIINFTQGNYKVATAEAIGCLWIEGREYLERKYQKRLGNSRDVIYNVFIPEINEKEKKLGHQFQKLYNKTDEIISKEITSQKNPS